jgi:hypothetical protein
MSEIGRDGTETMGAVVRSDYYQTWWAASAAGSDPNPPMEILPPPADGLGPQNARVGETVKDLGTVEASPEPQGGGQVVTTTEIGPRKTKNG